MLATSQGRLICLSTPCGKRGFFYKEWGRGGSDWKRIEVPAQQVSRIYPDFQRCVVADPAVQQRYPSSFAGQKVGGIDFGFRNPFAAVWGVLDRDGVLWLTGEHYQRYQPLSYHAAHLPREVKWYADPAGAGDIAELRHADYAVNPGINSLRSGISLVTARLQQGTLRIVKGACPNLLAEAELYRWSDDGDAEAPDDRDNHALAALRYLISRLDKRRLGKMLKGAVQKVLPEKKKPRPWLRYDNEALWTPVACWRRNWDPKYDG